MTSCGRRARLERGWGLRQGRGTFAPIISAPLGKAVGHGPRFSPSRPILLFQCSGVRAADEEGQEAEGGKTSSLLCKLCYIQAPISTIQISSQSDSLGHFSTAAAFIQISFIRTSRPGRNLKAGWVPADQAKTKPGQFRQTRPDSLCGVPRINLPRFASSQSHPSHPPHIPSHWLWSLRHSHSRPVTSHGIQTADKRQTKRQHCMSNRRRQRPICQLRPSNIKRGPSSFILQLLQR